MSEDVGDKRQDIEMVSGGLGCDATGAIGSLKSVIPVDKWI